MEWHGILKGKRIWPASLALRSGDFEGKYNSFIVPDNLADKIAAEVDGCEVVGGKGEKKWIEVFPSQEESIKVSQALSELSKIGYEVTSKVKLAKTPMDDVMAWYDKEIDTIFLTKKYLTTIHEIKNTLLEEHFHSKGQEDGNRHFVTFLIDEIIRSKENNN